MKARRSRFRRLLSLGIVICLSVAGFTATQQVAQAATGDFVYSVTTPNLDPALLNNALSTWENEGGFTTDPSVIIRRMYPCYDYSLYAPTTEAQVLSNLAATGTPGLGQGADLETTCARARIQLDHSDATAQDANDMDPFSGGTISVTSTGSGSTATTTLTIDVPQAAISTMKSGTLVTVIAASAGLVSALVSTAVCAAFLGPTGVVCPTIGGFMFGLVWNLVAPALNGESLADPDVLGAAFVAGVFAAVPGFLTGKLLALGAGFLRTMFQGIGQAAQFAVSVGGNVLRQFAGWTAAQVSAAGAAISAWFATMGSIAYDLISAAAQVEHIPTFFPGGLRVLPFGDSITNGFESSDGSGYRCDLQGFTQTQGNSSAYVGSLVNGTKCQQVNNEGHNGWTIGQLAGIEHCTVTGYAPNVVTLDIGTNDINNGGSATSAVTALENLILSIGSDDPNVLLLVSGLIPTPNATVAANMRQFNSAIESWISGSSSLANGAHIMFVDQSTVALNDLADGLHPNDTGYNKMGINWDAGLMTALQNGWIQAIHTPTGAQCAGTGGAPNWLPQGQIASGPGGATPAPGVLSLPSNASISYADIDGNGKADFLQVNSDGSVSAWLNNGAGSDGGVAWTPAGVIATGGVPGATVRFADLNGDGKADYLVVDPTSGAINAFLNGGAGCGTWCWNPLGTVASGTTPGADVRLADVNGDGKADYLAVDPDGAVTAYSNGGAGCGSWCWNPQGEIATGAGPGAQVTFADLNGDGKADYLVVSPTNGAIAAYLNGGPIAGSTNFNWEPQGTIASGVSTGSRLRLADIDGDHKADYLDVAPATGQTIEYHNGGPSAGGWIWNPLGDITAGGGDHFTFARMNADTKADYVDIAADGSVRVWYNNGGPGNWNWTGPVTIATGVESPGDDIRMADVNGDGLDDYLVVDPVSGAVKAWFNNTITWISQGTIATGVAPGAQIQFADINGDGKADYLVVNPASGAVTAYLNGGAGCGSWCWLPQGQIASGVAPGAQIQFADLNGDGKADYLIVSPDSAVAAYYNGGAGCGSWCWYPQGTVATGVGAPGGQIQFAELTLSGRADYLDVNRNGSVNAWING